MIPKVWQFSRLSTLKYAGSLWSIVCFWASCVPLCPSSLSPPKAAIETKSPLLNSKPQNLKSYSNLPLAFFVRGGQRVSDLPCLTVYQRSSFQKGLCLIPRRKKCHIKSGQPLLGCSFHSNTIRPSSSCPIPFVCSCPFFIKCKHKNSFPRFYLWSSCLQAPMSCKAFFVC